MNTTTAPIWSDDPQYAILRATYEEAREAVKRAEEDQESAFRMMEAREAVILSSPCPAREGGLPHVFDSGFCEAVGPCKHCRIDGGVS